MSNSSDDISGPFTSDTQATSSESDSSNTSIFTVGDASQSSCRTSRLLSHLHAPQRRLPIPADRDRQDPNKPLFIQKCLSVGRPDHLSSDELLRRDEDSFVRAQYLKLFEEKVQRDREREMEIDYLGTTVDEPPAAFANTASPSSRDELEQEESGMITDVEDNDSDPGAHAAQYVSSIPVTPELAAAIPMIRAPTTLLCSNNQSSEDPTISRTAKALEREFQLATAELQKAALDLRRFQDRRSLRTSTGATSVKMRAHALSKDAQYTRPSTAARTAYQRSARLRRRSASPVAGPSSVTIENMFKLEAERKQMMADASTQQSAVDFSRDPQSTFDFEDVLPSPPTIKTRARARALAKGKGRAF